MLEERSGRRINTVFLILSIPTFSHLLVFRYSRSQGDDPLVRRNEIEDKASVSPHSTSCLIVNSLLDHHTDDDGE